MTDKTASISYPRKIVIRSFLRRFGRLVISGLFNFSITGKENFPASGPLIVVGNHTAIMEAVLLNIYTPWQVEMLGAADIPHEKISQLFSDLYGFIPVNRGHVDRVALRTALDVLKQKGIIGIFPEGGIWEPGLMRAQTGVSWLSYRGQTPVLPIGFSGTLGALDKAVKLQRPNLTMKIGKVIPPIQKNTSIPRKKLFEQYAEAVMDEVRSLILPTDPSLQEKIKNERFELKYKVKDKDNKPIQIPEDIQIRHSTALVKLLHRPAILKLFYANLSLPIEPLLDINKVTDPQVITQALKPVLDYLINENPYLLIYRFGPKNGEEMQIGLQELFELSKWASQKGYDISITPIRRFYSLVDNKEITQLAPERFNNWM